MNHSQDEIESLFASAAALETESERADYLDRACPDPALRREIESLLRAHSEPDLVFVQAPARIREPGREGVGANIGPYKLLQQIGEGGCGTVFLAEQEEPIRRRVALKVIKLGMDTRSVIARFEAERQALALMDHPNIARVLDAGATQAGRPFFVMELVRGTRLTEFCDEQALTTRERIELFVKVCQAIQHAHQKGIIHRDLKPSNVLVTLHDGIPVPKVIDFGIAKATSEQRLTDKTLFTALEQFVGTPAYMSPEQAERSGLDIDTRSDIYSLGVLLYELLTGQTPFDGRELLAAGVEAMRRTILEREPARPSTRLRRMNPNSSAVRHPPPAPDIATDLDWIVMKALEKDRTRRYETANGLAADLLRHLNHEPVLARPPSASYRFRKAWRRNRLLFGAATLATVALVLGLALSLWQMFAARDAREREEVQRREAQSARGVADEQARQASESRRHAQSLLYASDLNLAQQALEQNNLGKARRLLERHRPGPGEEDLRGWEWRYLWQLIRGNALATLAHRSTRGTAVSFSPDGTRLAVGWYGGRVDLWDVPGRKWLRDLASSEVPHHSGRVAFSPVRNRLAATAGLDEVLVHDVGTGAKTTLWRSPNPGLWDVREVSFSPDGSRLVIYAGSVESLGDAAWVVNVDSAQIEGRYPSTWSNSSLHGAARLSPDNRRLYLSRCDSVHSQYSIQCLDVATGRELWVPGVPEEDYGLTALALSPDGQVLASGSGFEDPSIRIWDAATGRRIARLDGHTGWVCRLAFSQDGKHLVSAASDQSIRYWDTAQWTPTQVLRGHADEVYGVALSEAAQLVASAGKDGNLKLWREDGRSAANGYLRLPKSLRAEEVAPLDGSRLVLFPPGRWPEWISLGSGSPSVPLPESGSPGELLAFQPNGTLCRWDGQDRVLVHEWTGSEFVARGSLPVPSGVRPTEFAYAPGRGLMAWLNAASPRAIQLDTLGSPRRHGEFTNDLPWLTRFRFSEDGRHLAATARHDHSLRVFDVDSGRCVASLDERVRATVFAAGGTVLVAAIERGNDHDIGFFDLTRPGRPPRRVPGKDFTSTLAVSADGTRVAAATGGGQVLLFDARAGTLIDVLHGHLNGAHAVAFSPDGRRLISTSTRREAVKIWDTATRMELLTLSGIGSGLEAARWSHDGNVILAGAPWQAWFAPTWAEIAAFEATEKAAARKP